MYERINTLKDPKIIANTIWNFEVFQSGAVYGIVIDPGTGENISRGMMAIKLLKERYEKEYCDRNNSIHSLRKTRRNYPNSVGGDKAHPIWRYKEEIQEKDIKVTIWRVQ